MTVEPPGIDAVLGTEERAELLASLLRRDHVLQGLSFGTPSQPLPRVLTTGDLDRWRAIFREEVDLVHQARDRAVHQVHLEDGELRRAAWMAGELVRIVLGDADAGLV